MPDAADVDPFAGPRAVAALRLAAWEAEMARAIVAALQAARAAAVAAVRAGQARSVIYDLASLPADATDRAHGTGEKVYGRMLTTIDDQWEKGPAAGKRLPAYDLTGRLERLDYFVAELGSDTTAAVGQTLTEGANLGESIDDLARRVERTMGTSESRARLIARTEVVGASNEMSYDRATDTTAMLGFQLWKTWLATSTRSSSKASAGRTRIDHAIADGQTVPLDQDFWVGGVAMSHPGDPDGPPSQVCNCRCTLIYQEEPPLPNAASD